MPCVECRKAMEPEERAVEVNRHLLARLSTGPGLLALPVPSVVMGHQQRKGSSGLLSKKEAARLLGVDRATTLEDWLSTGRIKVVDLDGRIRIPRAEVERVINEGLPDATGPQRPRTRRAPKAATSRASETPGAEIRKLKL
jgi:excisionase family DNA binding protein